MCTPSPMTRDWTSCFLACSFSLDEEPNNKRSNKEMLRHKQCDRERRRNRGRTMTRDDVTIKHTTNESSRSHFTEEDYIVFCFGEDEEVDVAKDEKKEVSNCIDSMATSSKPPNAKKRLSYGRDVETIKINDDKETLQEDGVLDIYPTNDGDFVISCLKEEDDESIYFDIESNNCIVIVSAESSDSNQSDDSNGSFAFPVLGWEWMGSPVQMPRSQGMTLRKSNPRCVGCLQCCKF